MTIRENAIRLNDDSRKRHSAKWRFGTTTFGQMMCHETHVRLNTDSRKWYSTLYSFGNFPIRQYDDSTNWQSTTWRFGKVSNRWNDVSGHWCGPANDIAGPYSTVRYVSEISKERWKYLGFVTFHNWRCSAQTRKVSTQLTWCVGYIYHCNQPTHFYDSGSGYCICVTFLSQGKV